MLWSWEFFYLSWPAVSQICNLIFFPPEIENVIEHDLEYDEQQDHPLFEAQSSARVNHAWAIVVVHYPPRVPLFCSYNILTSSVIYYWTDSRQHGIYLLNRLQRQSKSHIRLTVAKKNMHLLKPQNIPYSFRVSGTKISVVARGEKIVAKSRSPYFRFWSLFTLERVHRDA